VYHFRTEREKYYSHRAKSRKEPDKYITLIVDGMCIVRVFESNSNYDTYLQSNYVAEYNWFMEN